MTLDLAFSVQKVAAGKKLLLFLFYVLTLQVTTYAYGKSIQQTVTNKQQPLGWSSASLPIILQASRGETLYREKGVENRIHVISTKQQLFKHPCYSQIFAY